MSDNTQLMSEIMDQLEEDILYFAWMVQIAREQAADQSESELVNAVIESVLALHGTGSIVVGNTRTVSGKLLIDAWPETGQNLRTRIESEIKNARREDHPFCFWIQLTDHFARGF